MKIQIRILCVLALLIAACTNERREVSDSHLKIEPDHFVDFGVEYQIRGIIYDAKTKGPEIHPRILIREIVDPRRDITFNVSHEMEIKPHHGQFGDQAPLFLNLNKVTQGEEKCYTGYFSGFFSGIEPALADKYHIEISTTKFRFIPRFVVISEKN